jgi:hypothetical protein
METLSYKQFKNTKGFRFYSKQIEVNMIGYNNFSTFYSDEPEKGERAKNIIKEICEHRKITDGTFVYAWTKNTIGIPFLYIFYREASANSN